MKQKFNAKWGCMMLIVLLIYWIIFFVYIQTWLRGYDTIALILKLAALLLFLCAAIFGVVNIVQAFSSRKKKRRIILVATMLLLFVQGVFMVKTLGAGVEVALASVVYEKEYTKEGAFITVGGWYEGEVMRLKCDQATLDYIQDTTKMYDMNYRCLTNEDEYGYLLNLR